MTVANYFLPGSLPEALALLDEHGPSLLVMAGGTVAMPLINEGLSLPEKVMGLRRAGLDRIDESDGTLAIGSTASLTRLVEQRSIPMLAEATRNTASWSIRNMGTVGGNLFTPPPGGDVATALLALDARVTLICSLGQREVPIAEFWTGFMTNVVREGELVTTIRVPLPSGVTSFVKFGRKQANTPAVVTVATNVTRGRGGDVIDARVALGAAGPHPIRARDAEHVLVGSRLEPEAIAEAAAAAAREAEPFSDGVASEWYRRRMVGLFVARALQQLVEPATAGRR